MTTDLASGGSWLGFGGIGAVVAVGLNVASHVRSKRQTAGQVAFGHVRYETIERVESRKSLGSWQFSFVFRARQDLVLRLITPVHAIMTEEQIIQAIALDRTRTIADPAIRQHLDAIVAHPQMSVADPRVRGIIIPGAVAADGRSSVATAQPPPPAPVARVDHADASPTWEPPPPIPR